MGFKGPVSSGGTTAGSPRRLLTTMSFLIRPWAKRDVQDVMRLVRELAKSHNALHQVRTSPEALQKDGFENDAIFGYLLAEVPSTRKSRDGHTIVGYQFHYLTYCTWDGPILFGEDLYVMPEFRGRGVGTALLNRAAKIALEKGCSQFRFISTEKHQSTSDFYRKKGAVDVTVCDHWHVFRIDRDPLAKLVEKAAAKPNPVSSQP
ncbi:thialysine N-epsilon-acetyltransferase isoform X1 [Erythrolamprus reginae]|uniref:thialysine N-epsilon-acetyltransferase isoform X1 n=1 Tax=Erythrolamprus reginae TaxID=121349 RepID=UPI00396C786F